jgi:hypothetical protein
LRGYRWPIDTGHGTLDSFCLPREGFIEIVEQRLSFFESRQQDLTSAGNRVLFHDWLRNGFDGRCKHWFGRLLGRGIDSPCGAACE